MSWLSVPPAPDLEIGVEYASFENVLPQPGLVQPTGARAHDRAVGVRRHRERPPVGIGNADDRVVVRRRGPRLERLKDGPAAVAGASAHASLGIDPDQLDARR